MRFFQKIIYYMEELKKLYNSIHLDSSSNFPIYPPKIYTDVSSLKNERIAKQKNYLPQISHKPLNLNAKKYTFLQQLQKTFSHMPSSQEYNPHLYQPAYKNKKYQNLPSRTTITEEIVKSNNKNPSPSPSQYSTLKKKSVSLGVFGKSQNATYLEGVMGNAINNPGVGNYNIQIKKKFIKLGKLGKQKRDSVKENKSPSPSAYCPRIPEKGLFSQVLKEDKLKPKFNREKRFIDKADKNKNFHYAGLSQWGMKSSYKKKDVLNSLSTHNIYSKSVYYQ